MSTKTLSQVDAVVNAVTEILGDSFTLGATVVSETLTSDQKQAVRARVKELIISGEVPCNKDPSNEGEFNRYVNGMINNSFMKSKKLNGGNPYKAKKRGAVRDETLKELTKFLATQTPGTPKYEETSSAILKRKAELTQTSSHDSSAATSEYSSGLNAES